MTRSFRDVLRELVEMGVRDSGQLQAELKRRRFTVSRATIERELALVPSPARVAVESAALIRPVEPVRPPAEVAPRPIAVRPGGALDRKGVCLQELHASLQDQQTSNRNPSLGAYLEGMEAGVGALEPAVRQLAELVDSLLAANQSWERNFDTLCTTAETLIRKCREWFTTSR